MAALRAPFPYFGGKRDVADLIWSRLGSPKHYIEPFCGSVAVLLSAPSPASLEVVNDINGFIANFWRAVVHQHTEVARWTDYPVSHIDQGARHRWLMEQRQRIGGELKDPNWPGDAQVAGWWLWGQCSWIGSGWCEWSGKVPHIGNAGMGVQAAGQVPHISDAGMGVQAAGQVPHISNAGMWTSAGRVALRWLGEIAERMERVRVTHGEWKRCLNNHYGGQDTALFFDPPYVDHEHLYGSDEVAAAVASWCAEHNDLRIALCGLFGDYDLDGWTIVEWKRKRLSYAGAKTTAREAIWFSPACLDPQGGQIGLFAAG